MIRSSSLTGRPQSSCLPDCPLPSSAGLSFSAVCPTWPFRRRNGRELRWTHLSQFQRWSSGPPLAVTRGVHVRPRLCVAMVHRQSDRPTTATCCVGPSPERQTYNSRRCLPVPRHDKTRSEDATTPSMGFDSSWRNQPWPTWCAGFPFRRRSAESSSLS